MENIFESPVPQGMRSPSCSSGVETVAIASIMAPGPGATDRLLSDVVAKLANEGARVLGALKAAGPNGATGHCEGDLWLLPDGPVVRITQDLGPGSNACRMDAGALEEAVGLTLARLAGPPADLVVLNKFGVSEAKGRGFRPLITEALARGIPVLVGVPEPHRAAFETFAAGLVTDLPPDAESVLKWCQLVTSVTTAIAEVDLISEPEASP